MLCKSMQKINNSEILSKYIYMTYNTIIKGKDVKSYTYNDYIENILFNIYQIYLIKCIRTNNYYKSIILITYRDFILIFYNLSL